MKIAQRENTEENQPAKADTGSAGTEQDSLVLAKRGEVKNINFSPTFKNAVRTQQYISSNNVNRLKSAKTQKRKNFYK